MSLVNYITSLEEFPTTGLAVVDFYADWCGPCKRLAPIFDELSKEHTAIKFYKVNSDEAEELAQKYEVQALPTILFLKEGEVVSMIRGANVQAIKDELIELEKSSETNTSGDSASGQVDDCPCSTNITCGEKCEEKVCNENGCCEK